MRRRSAITLGMLLLAAAGAFLFQRCGEDVPEAGFSRGPSSGATPLEPAGLAPRGVPAGVAPPPPEAPGSGPRVVAPTQSCPVNTRTRGSVIDVEGRPIAGATVVGVADVGGEIGPGEPVTTDAQGRFDVEVLNDDIAAYTVSAPGFIERTLARQSRDASGIVLERENRSRVRLVLSGDAAEGDRFRWLVGDAETQRIAPPRGWLRGGGLPTPSPKDWDPDAPEIPISGGVLELPRPFPPGVSRHLLVGERGSIGPFWIHVPSGPGTLDIPVRALPLTRLGILVTRVGTPVVNATVFVRSKELDRELAGAATDAGGRALVTVLDVRGRSVEVAYPVTFSVPLPDGVDHVTVDIAVAESLRDENATLNVHPFVEETFLPPGRWDGFAPAPVPIPAASPPMPPPPATGRLVGRIAAATWPPLEMGYVRAVRWTPEGTAPAPSELSMSAGLGTSPRFSFDHLPPGRWLLFLRCGGFVATSDGPVDVRPGETTDVGDLALRRGAELSGRVFDAEGMARAFTRVSLRDEAGALTLSAWTDPDGGYRVVGLWPGPWHASLDGEGGLELPLAKARVTGSAEHRLDLRPVPPR